MDQKQLLIQGGVLVVGTGIGFGAGYLVFKKKFERIAEQEIMSVREAYAKNAVPKPNLDDLAGLFKNEGTLIEGATRVVISDESIIGEQGYSGSDDTDAEMFQRANGRVPTTYELIQMGKGVPISDIRNPSDHDDIGIREGNIFDNPDIVDIDPETLGEGEDELPPRSLDRPYVIETSEWYLNETNYDQITLTYWADDDVLAGDDKRVITDVDTVVGATNLHRFGFKSDNPDIVYVRNDKLKADYEITKDERNYAEVVHGVDSDEDASGAPRRMRSNDE